MAQVFIKHITIRFVLVVIRCRNAIHLAIQKGRTFKFKISESRANAYIWGNAKVVWSLNSSICRLNNASYIRICHYIQLLLEAIHWSKTFKHMIICISYMGINTIVGMSHRTLEFLMNLIIEVNDLWFTLIQ